MPRSRELGIVLVNQTVHVVVMDQVDPRSLVGAMRLSSEPVGLVASGRPGCMRLIFSSVSRSTVERAVRHLAVLHRSGAHERGSPGARFVTLRVVDPVDPLAGGRSLNEQPGDGHNGRRSTPRALTQPELTMSKLCRELR